MSKKPIHHYTENAWQGANYKPYQDIKDIAKTIKQRLKNEYPKCKFSVTISRYSGGQSLTVALVEAPFKDILNHGQLDYNTLKFQPSEYQYSGYNQINHYYLNFEKDYHKPCSLRPDGWNNGVILTEDAWRCLEKVNQIVSSYNYDDSDSMIDYFNTNFYFHLEIGKYNKPFKQII